MSLFAELKRRNVFRVAIAYIVISWLVLQVGDTLAPILRVPDSVNSILFFFLLLGFWPAVLFAWAFELTPEGLKREKNVDRTKSITSNTGRKLDYLTIAAVVGGVAFVIWSKTSVQVDNEDVASIEVEQTKVIDASVAVLPFVNMSGSQENEYFSDGLTETLLHMLAQLPELKVAARTSSFAFKGQNSDVKEIAGALGVAHVLEGSVQRSGDRVRITAQLIRASDGFHVWSENYDRTLDDIFGIQDEIAKEVGDSLSASLLGISEDRSIDGVSTKDIDAYDLYLQALSENATFSYGGLQKSEGLLKEALAMDPSFLDAKVELASNYRFQINTGLRERDSTDTDIIAMMEQVLVARPTDARAQVLLAEAESNILFWSGDNEGAFAGLDEIRQVVRRSPGEVEIRYILAGILANIGEEDEALEHLEAAVTIDPLNPVVYFEVARAHTIARNFDEAKRAMRRSLELEPSQPNAYGILAEVAALEGDGMALIENEIAAIRIDSQDHELPSDLAVRLYRMGLLDYGDKYLERAKSISSSSPATQRALMHQAIAAGDEAKALQVAKNIIESGVDNRSGVVTQAIRYISQAAVRNGTQVAAAEYFETVFPGYSDWDAESQPFRVHRARTESLELSHERVSRQELIDRMEQIYALFQQYGFTFADSPGANVRVLALSGKTDEAIDVALTEYFTKSYVWFGDWKSFFAQPYLADVVADPRVQEELQRWESEEAAYSEQVQAYLASL